MKLLSRIRDERARMLGWVKRPGPDVPEDPSADALREAEERLSAARASVVIGRALDRD